VDDHALQECLISGEGRVLRVEVQILTSGGPADSVKFMCELGLGFNNMCHIYSQCSQDVCDQKDNHKELEP